MHDNIKTYIKDHLLEPGLVTTHIIQLDSGPVEIERLDDLLFIRINPEQEKTIHEDFGSGSDSINDEQMAHRGLLFKTEQPDNRLLFSITRPVLIDKIINEL